MASGSERDEEMETEDVDKDDSITYIEERRKKAPRCTKCQRMTKGHEGRSGSTCQMKTLNEVELKDDDAKKLKVTKKSK